MFIAPSIIRMKVSYVSSLFAGMIVLILALRFLLILYIYFFVEEYLRGFRLLLCTVNGIYYNGTKEAMMPVINNKTRFAEL